MRNDNHYDSPETVFRILKDFKIYLSDEEKESMRRMPPRALHRYKRNKIDAKLEATLNAQKL